MSRLEHTFVICAYGDSPYLEECIKSLMNQTLKTNIILYTSTPSKYIEALCTQYDLPYFISKGGSIGKDGNNALSFVETQYATIADQDDYYEPNYAQEIMKKAKLYRDFLILYTNYFEEKKGKRISKTVNLKIKTAMLRFLNCFSSWKFWRTRILSFGNAICCPAVTYNLANLDKFQFDESLRGNLDWIAWYQIAQLDGRFIFLDKELMCHRIHSDSETSKTIKHHTRTDEDLATLSLFWPKWFATFIMKFYVKSQQTND